MFPNPQIGGFWAGGDHYIYIYTIWRCAKKYMFPYIIHFNKIVHYNPSILRDPPLSVTFAPGVEGHVSRASLHLAGTVSSHAMWGPLDS